LKDSKLEAEDSKYISIEDDEYISSVKESSKKQKTLNKNLFHRVQEYYQAKELI
jgi:hypothetical protein